ncbi:MAG: hypothetical protein GIKADHBN_00305 [Phycisphaerales bacterium]|nr:hypothetical protein [Phycisphaerales bacterium]
MSLHPKSGGKLSRDEAVCVVWHPRGSAPQRVLLDTLAHKGFRIIACDSAVEATAWVCASAGPGVSQRAESMPVVLLIDRPGLVPVADEVLKTIERYAPRAARWTYDPQATPRLRRALPPADAKDEEPASPPLRLTAEEKLEEVKPISTPNPVEEVPAVTTGGSLRNLLTDQELAMLLGDAGLAPEQHPHQQRVPRS